MTNVEKIVVAPATVSIEKVNEETNKIIEKTAAKADKKAYKANDGENESIDTTALSDDTSGLSLMGKLTLKKNLLIQIMGLQEEKSLLLRKTPKDKKEEKIIQIRIKAIDKKIAKLKKQLEKLESEIKK